LSAPIEGVQSLSSDCTKDNDDEVVTSAANGSDSDGDGSAYSASTHSSSGRRQLSASEVHSVLSGCEHFQSLDEHKWFLKKEVRYTSLLSEFHKWLLQWEDCVWHIRSNGSTILHIYFGWV
jgi:hypothetical protein